MICTYCLQHSERKISYFKTSTGCSYDLHHSYDEESLRPKPQPVQVVKLKKDLCVKCGIHPRNPIFLTNGCVHEFG